MALLTPSVRGTMITMMIKRIASEPSGRGVRRGRNPQNHVTTPTTSVNGLTLNNVDVYRAVTPAQLGQRGRAACLGRKRKNTHGVGCRRGRRQSRGSGGQDKNGQQRGRQFHYNSCLICSIIKIVTVYHIIIVIFTLYSLSLYLYVRTTAPSCSLLVTRAVHRQWWRASQLPPCLLDARFAFLI